MIKAGRSVEVCRTWRDAIVKLLQIYRIKKSGQNKTSYKSGTFMKISSTEECKKSGRPVKKGQMACIE